MDNFMWQKDFQRKQVTNVDFHVSKNIVLYRFWWPGDLHLHLHYAYYNQNGAEIILKMVICIGMKFQCFKFLILNCYISSFM